MRAALHVIDEELLAAGHNSGTTVNALLVVDDLATVINTGDCRCILYDYIEEKAVQVRPGGPEVWRGGGWAG